MKAIYFSPTYSTKKIVEKVALSINKNFESIDITMGLSKDLVIDKSELVIIGVPVYSGRVPLLACEILKKIKADNAKVVTIAIYGNRNYDNALIELNQICEQQGFDIIASAAFIAEHSLSSIIATNRPDSKDLIIAEEFAALIVEKLENNIFSQIIVPGSNPLPERKKATLYSVANDNCTQCGICAPACPTQAIDYNDARITNTDLCICCVRCIKICPENARAINLDKDKKEVFLKGLLEKCEGYKSPELFV